MDSQNDKISYDAFARVEMRVGQIKAVEPVPDTDRLLRLTVDFGLKPSQGDGPSEGERDIRQIISGIAEYYPDLSVLQEKKCIFVSNLAPRMLRGFESNGMILAATTQEGVFTLVVPEKDVPPGTKLR